MASTRLPQYNNGVKMENKKSNFHIHIVDPSPVLEAGMQNLLEKKVFATKTELCRAGILNILQIYCPSLLKEEIEKGMVIEK